MKGTVSPVVDRVLERAGQWMLDSGIREASGGVARYYLAAEGRNLPVSTEITGYAASTFAYLWEATGEPRYREAAGLTADYLTGTAWNADLETFPFETSPGSPAYFFDCGIIVRGLVAAGRCAPNPALRDIAQRAARSMARDFLTPTAIHPVVSLPDRRPWAYEKRWSREPGCFLLKAALAWRDTGETRSWELALAQALSSWDTFLPGDPDPLRVMDRLHAHSYFLEALLAETGRPECRAALQAGIAKTAHYLRDIAPRFARSDVYAQLLRVRLFAHALGAVPIDYAAAEEEAAAIPAFQYEPGDPRLDGGFSFGRRDGQLMPFANPVSTGFCLQALHMWSEFQAGSFRPRLEVLI